MGVVGGLDNRIRGEEFAEDGIIEPGAVVVEAELVIVFLVGEGVVDVAQETDGGVNSVPEPFAIRISKNQGNVALRLLTFYIDRLR